MLHHIQKNILDTLATGESLRYSELKPESLDGNVFGYHLKSLIRDAYVTKTEQGNYRLTSQGKEYIVHRYENPLRQAHSILLIAIKRGDTWLMRERLTQPHIGEIGFIHGEPIAGELIVESALRRLHLKTGLSATLETHSSGLIAIKKQGVLESYSHAVLLTGTVDKDYTTPEDATGRQSWRTIEEIKQQEELFLPSCLPLIERIETDDRSVFDLTYNT